ncbi:MAG TPA: hypothetical protein VKB80_33520 [Kofleriaceae bacterium]|nr:hypothetical protein [Kofleriaceae bacterium]
MRERVLILVLLIAACGGDDGMDDGAGAVDDGEFPYLVDLRVWQYADGRANLGACLYRYSLCESLGTVEVEHGNQAVTLGHDRESSGEWYVGTFATTAAGEPFRFTWSGADEQSPVTGEVWLPDEFTITAPVSGSAVSAAKPVTLEWTGGSPGGLMAWGYSASCIDGTINDFDHLVPDSGRVEISTDQLAVDNGCSVNLWLERLRRGTTSYSRANIMATRSRYVDVTVGP